MPVQPMHQYIQALNSITCWDSSIKSTDDVVILHFGLLDDVRRDPGCSMVY
jgi:hypothetical protein